MTTSGPKWFSEPAHSIDYPFGYEAVTCLTKTVHCNKKKKRELIE